MLDGSGSSTQRYSAAMMLQNRPVALVVGATGGIGRAVAVALGEHYTVCVAGRNEEALNTLAETLPDAICWRVDLRAGEMPSEKPSILSKLDLLVHCAGSIELGSIGDTPIEVWRNLLPALRATRGRVIIVNSTAVSGSPANRAAYASSKAALRAFAGALHQEELANGIRVTSVYPGRVDTKGQRKVRALEKGPYEPERYLSPSSVAAAIRWVVSAPADAHITEFEVKPTWR